MQKNNGTPKEKVNNAFIHGNLLVISSSYSTKTNDKTTATKADKTTKGYFKKESLALLYKYLMDKNFIALRFYQI